MIDDWRLWALDRLSLLLLCKGSQHVAPAGWLSHWGSKAEGPFLSGTVAAAGTVGQLFFSRGRGMQRRYYQPCVI